MSTTAKRVGIILPFAVQPRWIHWQRSTIQYPLMLIAMKKMNIPYILAVLGAHIDAFFHKDIKTGERKLDSKDDQQLIRMGYYYKKK